MKSLKSRNVTHACVFAVFFTYGMVENSLQAEPTHLMIPPRTVNTTSIINRCVYKHFSTLGMSDS